MKIASVLDDRFKTGMAKLASANIPMKSAFKLKGILNTINAELSKYNEVRLEAMKKYVKITEKGDMETDDKGNAIFKSEDDKLAFVKEHFDLISVDFEVKKIKLDELGNLDTVGVNITLEELQKLEETVLEI